MIQMFDLWFLLNELETKLNVGTIVEEEETNEATATTTIAAAPSPPARRKENTENDSHYFWLPVTGFVSLRRTQL